MFPLGYGICKDCGREHDIDCSEDFAHDDESGWDQIPIPTYGGTVFLYVPLDFACKICGSKNIDFGVSYSM